MQLSWQAEDFELLLRYPEQLNECYALQATDDAQMVLRSIDNVQVRLLAHSALAFLLL